jgi:hypothetical protein
MLHVLIKFSTYIQLFFEKYTYKYKQIKYYNIQLYTSLYITKIKKYFNGLSTIPGLKSIYCFYTFCNERFQFINHTWTKLTNASDLKCTSQLEFYRNSL